MTSISGIATNAGFKIATTWGTAVAAGTGNRIAAEITPSANVSELLARQIGSGTQMLTAATRGHMAPSANLAMDLGYLNGVPQIIAQMLGTSGAPTETTTSQGDYLHRTTYNTTLNAKFGTFAYTDSSTTAIEFSTCAVTQIGIKPKSVPGFIDFTCTMLGNDFTTGSSTNTTTTLAATTNTEGNPELAEIDFSDTLWTNGQSGSGLSSGVQYNVTSWDLQLQRPQEMTAEIRGAAGNSAPVPTGLFGGTFVVTVNGVADHAYWTIWSAETLQKASVNVQGTQIGSGTNKSFTAYMPSMKLITEPVYAVTSEGVNALTLTFRLLKAATNPTSMNSTYPYFEWTNTLSTSLLA